MAASGDTTAGVQPGPSSFGGQLAALRKDPARAIQGGGGAAPAGVIGCGADVSSNTAARLTPTAAITAIHASEGRAAGRRTMGGEGAGAARGGAGDGENGGAGREGGAVPAG